MALDTEATLAALTEILATLRDLRDTLARIEAAVSAPPVLPPPFSHPPSAFLPPR